MYNKFYNEFDFERVNESKRKDEYRTPFQIDRDRLIHSSEFRRLQGKTQVFIPGEYDYYRTRLTHSIEVAQIGRSICNFLRKKYDGLFTDDYFIDTDLVESACLAHDLGHPPFGHAGERTLNKLMKPYGGFEGNAQTLRLLTEIFYTFENSRRGMKPTRALLDSILKYKALYGDFNNPYNHFLYNYQKEVVDFIFGGMQKPDSLNNVENLNNFKSIECQIMDWADDTAYATNDLVDSISGGFITIIKLERWFSKNEAELSEIQKETYHQIVDWIRTRKFKAQFGSEIGELVESCQINERKTFLDTLTNRYKYELIIENSLIEKVELYKRIAVELVFRSSQLHQMEYKGDMMITSIFKALESNYITEIKDTKLLPDFSDTLIRSEKEMNTRARLVCDYIAGMTDSFAMTNYKRLFDPDYSSIKDYI
ncbi:MAG: dNTP triphosphohydrolase [Melioribacteraceae bacterium]|nr:dNTP triphosphohydrolase [Melioribacteraceae bacterium]